MRIGVVKEIKPAEMAGGPHAGRHSRTGRGGQHACWSKKGAGEGSGFPDAAYLDAGRLVDRQRGQESGPMWTCLVKVKEPIEPEFPLLHQGLILFTYLHLAADSGADRRAGPFGGHRRGL